MSSRRLGPTGKAVASNVADLRQKRRLTFAVLAARCANLGAPIPQLGLRQIEQGIRPVSVDEAQALATALGVSLPRLLNLHSEATSYDFHLGVERTIRALQKQGMGGVQSRAVGSG